MTEASTLKMILIGDGGVGKSALTFRYCDNVFLVDHVATLGVDFKYTVATIPPSGQQVRLQIWDTAGQETFLTLTTAYYRGCHAAFICFDLTNRVSYESVPAWYERLEEHGGDGSQRNADPYDTRESNTRSRSSSVKGCQRSLPIPCVLVGCKSDLADNDTISMRQVSSAEATKWAADHGIAYMETSSKDNVRVQEVFLYLAGLALNQLTGGGPSNEFDSLQAHNAKKQLPQRGKPVKSLGGGPLESRPKKKETGCSC